MFNHSTRTINRIVPTLAARKRRRYPVGARGTSHCFVRCVIRIQIAHVTHVAHHGAVRGIRRVSSGIGHVHHRGTMFH